MLYSYFIVILSFFCVCELITKWVGEIRCLSEKVQENYLYICIYVCVYIHICAC